MTTKPSRDEESLDGAQRSKTTVIAVWVFIVLELVLTVLTAQALWAKARGITPFSRTATVSPRSDRNECDAP